jgi:hypothetical protein
MRPRNRPPVRGIPGHLTRWLRDSRTHPDAVARRGLRYGGRPDRYPTTQRGRPGPGEYCDAHRTSDAEARIGGGALQRAAASERADDTGISAKRFVVCRACSTAWGCKSPTQPDGGEVLAKRKGIAARRCLKEAWSKTATRRTEIGYQAVQVGRADNLPRSPHPSRAWGVDPAGVRGRRSNLPREVCAVSR